MSGQQTTDRRHRPSFADEAGIDLFVAQLHRFERGEIDAEQWRACRAPQGVYTQRQEGLHMLRVKLPQGIASAEQLRALAHVARTRSRGFVHVTTRQDVQYHFVRPRDLEAALRHLAAAGITSSGGCGNTVRNVVACPFAGVSAGEAFDVTPYAEAVSRHFLHHPLASSLPRKFKVAFEGCGEDHAATAIQDLGFRARLRSEGAAAEKGFAVTVGGGTSTLCASGAPLLEFLPASDVLALAEAVVRVFHARGDRKNRKRNRLKFLVRELGLEAFRTLVTEELARVLRHGAPTLPFDPDRPPREDAPTGARRRPPQIAAVAERIAGGPVGPAAPMVAPDVKLPPCALASFQATNVRPQRQAGFSVVTVAPPLGDVTAAQLEILAELALAYGDGTVRMGNDGHVHLRWVREAEIPALYARLAAAGLDRAGAGSAADVVACPGGDVCELAVTRTGGVARSIEDRVRNTFGDLALVEPLTVRVSGCPHGCGQHHVAAIGLQGAERKHGGRAVPHYAVLAGGAVGEGGARFAKLVGKVPASRAPEAVTRLMALWFAERAEGERAADFFARVPERARAAIADLRDVEKETAGAEISDEPGAGESFRAEVRRGVRAA